MQMCSRRDMCYSHVVHTLPRVLLEQTITLKLHKEQLNSPSISPSGFSVICSSSARLTGDEQNKTCSCT